MHELTEEERSEFQPAGDQGEPSLGIISSTQGPTTWLIMPTCAAFSNDHCLRPPKSPLSPASTFTEDTNTSGTIAVLAACLVTLDLTLPESGYWLGGHPFSFHRERARCDGDLRKKGTGRLVSTAPSSSCGLLMQNSSSINSALLGSHSACVC